ncbi:MAG: acetyl-CoA carboxylase biotin carboxyl carrier protein [Planctomycetes bacterium]|nr:acetyl-CoA carboxylase biotin carboxyl carrier protein [Planctomycetota bacterium]
MAEGGQDPPSVFDLDRLRALIDLMREHDVGEVDLRDGEKAVRIARGSRNTAPVGAMIPVAAAPTPTVPSGSALTAPPDGANIVVIKSPMVGTFYSRPNPNAEPFIKVGDHIEPETTVCIIEAMKMFNEIPAEVRGKIVAVLVNDEEPVDHGKPLFKVDTTG